MPHNILFSFVGETPQVVTEQIYCLWAHKQIMGGKAHLLTTTGMHSNATNLIEKIKYLCEEYDLDWKFATEDCFDWRQDGIQVLNFPDINTKENNKAAIDAITRIIHYWCSQDDVHLYASLAGGRKQLGSYMYQALSWFGRYGQDSLSHVVPRKELEGDPPFPSQWADSEGYFPAKEDNNHPDKYIDFIEQDITFFNGLLPNVLTISEDKQFLDNDDESEDFPFTNNNQEANGRKYLKYVNISNRSKFFQGLVHPSDNFPIVKFSLLDCEGRSTDRIVMEVVSPRIGNNSYDSDFILSKKITLTGQEFIWFLYLKNIAQSEDQEKRKLTAAGFSEHGFCHLAKIVLDTNLKLINSSQPLIGSKSMWSFIYFFSADLDERYNDMARSIIQEVKNSSSDSEQYANDIENGIIEIDNEKIAIKNIDNIEEFIKNKIWSNPLNYTSQIGNLSHKINDTKEGYGDIAQLPFFILRVQGKYAYTEMPNGAFFNIELDESLSKSN